jgi:hypothetical protein
MAKPGPAIHGRPYPRMFETGKDLDALNKSGHIAVFRSGVIDKSVPDSEMRFPPSRQKPLSSASHSTTSRPPSAGRNASTERFVILARIALAQPDLVQVSPDVKLPAIYGNRMRGCMIDLSYYRLFTATCGNPGDYVDIVGVTGSIPVAPTIFFKGSQEDNSVGQGIQVSPRCPRTRIRSGTGTADCRDREDCGPARMASGRRRSFSLAVPIARGSVPFRIPSKKFFNQSAVRD